MLDLSKRNSLASAEMCFHSPSHSLGAKHPVTDKDMGWNRFSSSPGRPALGSRFPRFSRPDIQSRVGGEGLGSCSIMVVSWIKNWQDFRGGPVGKSVLPLQGA